MYSVMMKKAIDILKRVISVSYQNISRDQKYMYNHRDNFIDFKLCDISVTESLRRNLFCYIIIIVHVITCSIYEYFGLLYYGRKAKQYICYHIDTLLTSLFLQTDSSHH